MQNEQCRRAGTGAVKWAAATVIVLAATSRAGAETTQCTAITSVPYTISASGSYCLTGDLTTSISDGAAITIEANAVTLDLNGYKLAGNAGSATNAYGIYAVSRKYVVVRNGTIRGFLIGVGLLGSIPDTVANIIERITAEGNWYIAVQVVGTGCVIRRNLVVRTGGTTRFGANSFAYALLVSGTGHMVRDNDIATVTGTGAQAGFGPRINGDNTLFERNHVSDAHTGVIAVGSNILVSANRFTNTPVGINYSTNGTGKYRDNLTSGVTTLAIGGTDAGGNN